MEVAKAFTPIHTDEMLGAEWLDTLAVAKASGVSRTRIERIAREGLRISADTDLPARQALRAFWLSLQTRCHVLMAEVPWQSTSSFRGHAGLTGPASRP
jgi:plasmid maintenance system antidote protein VapI